MRDRDLATPDARGHGLELALAAACLAGDTGAIATLERDYLVYVPEWVQHRVRNAADALDLRAAVRERVLAPPLGKKGLLASYAGRGPLSGWLRVVALRLALDAGDQHKRIAERQSRIPSSPAADDPLADVLRVRYLPVLNASLSAAFAALDTRQRHLLRTHFIDGVSLDTIARIYGKNRSTVFRWLEAAREQILSHSLAHVRAEMGASETDVASLLRWLDSQMSVNLASL